MLYLVGEMVVLIVGAFGLGYLISWLIHADRASSSKNVHIEHLTDESTEMRKRNETLEDQLAESQDELDDLRREHDIALDSALVTHFEDDYRELRVGEDETKRVEIDNGKRSVS